MEVSEIATSTVQHLHEVASVVVTAGGSADAVGGAGGSGLSAEDDADCAVLHAMVGGGGTATDMVLRALNLYRDCLEGQLTSEGDEASGGDERRAAFASDDEDDWGSVPAAGFGDVLPRGGDTGAEGAAWASLSDDDEQ